MSEAVVTGLDYSAGRPRGQAVRDAGYAFVLRYLSWLDNPKDLTRAELDDMTAAGIGVGTVFETTASRALSGHQGGRWDALKALDLAEVCGLPDDHPHYFAVDFDAQPHQYETVRDYLRGVASVIPINRIGVYGSHAVCKMLLDLELVTYCWQTEAWSAGQWDPRFHIIQRVGYVTVDGIQCDVNELNLAHGSWGLYGMDDNMEWRDSITFANPATGESATFQADQWVTWTNYYAAQAAANTAAVRVQLEAVMAALAQIAAGDSDPEAIKQAVLDAMAEGTVKVTVAIQGAQAAMQEAMPTPSAE